MKKLEKTGKAGNRWMIDVATGERDLVAEVLISTTVVTILH